MLQPSVTFKVVSAMFILSKVSRCRDIMRGEPNNADIILNRIMAKAGRTNDLRLKANCSRTLKNLASEADDGLEEGEVASLILSSLEVVTAHFVYKIILRLINHMRF